MRKILLVAAAGLLGLMSCATALADDMSSPVGTWKTVDDKTGRVKSLVKIFDVNGKLAGQVVEVYPAPGEDPDPVCDKCTSSLHGKKIKGMTIMWGFHKDDEQWVGGRIFDPQKSGSDNDPYRSKIWLENGGQDLIVRGYLGFFYRSQTWHRVMGK